TNAVEIVLQVFPIIPPLLLRPFCRPLPTPPGACLLRLPPALLLISSSLRAQGPLGIGHRELSDGKRCECDAVHRRLILIEPLIAADVIRPAGDVDKRRQQVGVIRPVPGLETRIAQLAQRETRSNARP